jgi:MFS transporter, OFA family, oxalate/formate antiporter
VYSRWTNFPFAPIRFPFFYGWVMLFGSLIAILASIPGQTMGVGVFTDHLIAAWHLDRVQLSAAYMIGTIISGFSLPFAGRLLDTMGSRAMVSISAVGLGLSMALIASADQLVGPQSTIAAFTIVAVCFLCLRFFGQGCLAMVSRVIVGQWFNYRRGLATSFIGLFAAFGFNASPVLLNMLVDGWGWRGAYFILAGVIGIGVSILGALIYRNTPEECGLVMDGAPPEKFAASQARKVPQATRDFTRGEALRTWAFWVFSLALGSHGLIMTAVTFHIVSIGGEMGLTPDEAVAIFWPMAFFGVAANFISGWFADRTKLKYLLFAFLFVELVGTAGLLNLDSGFGRVLITCGYGCAGGLFVQLSTVAWPRFFGRTNLGAISGLNMSVMVFSSAVGPLLFSTIQSFTGSYREVVLAYCLIPIMLLAVGLKANNPQGTA